MDASIGESSAIPHPYTPGSKHTLFLHSNNLQTCLVPAEVTATIQHAFEPFTISPVVHVSLSASDGPAAAHLPSSAILKLYDPRFASSLRASKNLGSWTVTQQRALYQYYRNPDGPHEHFVEEACPSSPSMDPVWSHLDTEDPHTWSIGRREALVRAQCQQYFSAETAVYAHLRDLQGFGVPQIYGTVTCEAEMGLCVQGLLMEYVAPSFTLLDLQKYLPEEYWVEIAKDVLALVRKIDEYDVVNGNARLDNILVAKGGPLGWRVVMVDFALARLKHADEDEDSWMKLKSLVDEEGEIVADLKRKFGVKVGPALPRLRYIDERSSGQNSDNE